MILKSKVAGRSRWISCFTFAVAASLLLRVLLIDHESTIRNFSPGCFLHRFTGLHCAGCGGTRAFFAFLKGDLALSWRMNPLFLIGLCWGLVFGVLVILDRRPRGRPQSLAWIRVTPGVGWSLLALTVLFSVLRNIPSWPFTLLAPP